MSGNTITAADCIFTLTVDNIYPSGVVLEGFAADNIYTTDTKTLAETVLGADGYLSAGFVHTSVNQTISIMPDSDSWDVFENWATLSVAGIAVFRCSATVLLPALGKKYTHINGVFKSWKALPDAQRVLQAGQAVIEWGRVVGEIIGN